MSVHVTVRKAVHVAVQAVFVLLMACALASTAFLYRDVFQRRPYILDLVFCVLFLLASWGPRLALERMREGARR